MKADPAAGSGALDSPMLMAEARAECGCMDCDIGLNCEMANVAAFTAARILDAVSDEIDTEPAHGAMGDHIPIERIEEIIAKYRGTGEG